MKMLMMQIERVIAVVKITAGFKKILDHELSKIFSNVHCFSFNFIKKRTEVNYMNIVQSCQFNQRLAKMYILLTAIF